MIISFGYICMELETPLRAPLTFPCEVKSDNASLKLGGKSANQAIAAARCGAKISLIGAIGNDIFGKTILAALRKEGIHTSGIAKKELASSVINSIIDADGLKASMIMQGANAQISAEQIPDNSLNEKTLLLLQNNIDLDININILKRANKGGARSIMCMEHVHENKVNQDIFDYIDIAIISEDINRYISITQENIKVKIVIINHKNRAFDAFCGCFAACLQAGLTLNRSIERGHKAAEKYITDKDFPYLCDRYIVLPINNS